jgi:hypothetical protein
MATISGTQRSYHPHFFYSIRYILRASPSLGPHMDASPHGGRFLKTPHGYRLFKLLLHYDFAWWRALGLVDGSFERFANSTGSFNGACEGGPAGG